MNDIRQSTPASRARTGGPTSTPGHAKVRRFAIKSLSGAILVSLATVAQAGLPTGGVVTAGKATMTNTANTTTINQTTAKVVINWNSFSIGAGETVQFIQPDSQSVALNRVLGADPSVILGNLIANGKVFLVNPNGILFGNGASVNVGGLVASTMNITDANFLAGRHEFTNAGSGSVVNSGTITAADGGHVVLMGRSVSNQGVIEARLGSVALAAGEAVTMDVAGDGLLHVAVSTGAVNALAENGGMIQADGGRVLLTAQAAGHLLNTVVNNTGTIQAQTIENRNGTILLLGDMQSGTMNVGGTLDASAPNGGNGGFIETSAARVNIGDSMRVTTAATRGQTGTWLIDPQDFTIGSAPGNNISGATLSDNLTRNSVIIDTNTFAGAGNGDIFVNDVVSWTASANNPTTLSLIANGKVDINAAITAVEGNLSVCCGQDINVNGAISVTRGSVLLAAGRDINQRAAITVTDGNLMMCAANNVNIFSAITLTRGTNDPTRSLGLPLGLTLSADTDGTGPGIAGGTVVIDSLAPKVTVTNAPVSIYYNPVSYAAPTDYLPRFTLTGSALSDYKQYMLVFADGGDKAFDGTTTATLLGLKGNPPGVTLVAGPNASANYTSPEAGANKRITFSGYTLAGANAGAYALPVNCCGPVVASTTGTIAPATPPPTTPPPTTPPPTTPPPTTPPPTTPPPTTPPPTTPPPTTPPPTTPTTPPPTTPPPPVSPPVLPPPGTYFGVIPPAPVLIVLPPEELVVVTTESPPPMALTVTVPPERVPYVAPVRKPKPYRN